MTIEELLKDHRQTKAKFVNLYKNTVIYEIKELNIKLIAKIEYRDDLDLYETVQNLSLLEDLSILQ